MKDIINLVNNKGERVGAIEKLEAHKTGQMHEAFSIFIFNKNKELLLQKRNDNKYHSGGLWSNTCCSHPREGEKLETAVHRRLKEEMGFDCILKEIGSFVYKVKLSNEITEHEFDYVFTGFVDDVIMKPDLDEVSDYKWVSMGDLKKDIVNSPDKYSEWLKIILSNNKFNSMLNFDRVAHR